MRALMIFLTAATLSAPALAHPGLESHTGFFHQFLHMIGGFEPLVLLAVIAGAYIAYTKRFR